MYRPLFSIVYPTRNRPEFIDICLKSLTLQIYKDFEVIICDNYTTKSAKNIFNKYKSFENFKYIRPKSNLSMSDNWEWALKHAKGEYISVLTDKMLLLPSALKIAKEAIEKNNFPNIVSWWNDSINLVDEKKNKFKKIVYLPIFNKINIEQKEYSKYELEKRYSFSVRNENEGIYFYRGKICFGLYKRDLIKKIQKDIGRLFFKISPDYTSMISALFNTKSFIDLGYPLQTTINSILSNGANAKVNPSFMLSFLKEYESDFQKFLKNLPLKGLYCSQHNIIAYDYLMMLKKINKKQVKINYFNLLKRASEDFLFLRWDDNKERNRQILIVFKYFIKLKIGLKCKFLVNFLKFFFNFKKKEIKISLSNNLYLLFPILYNIFHPEKKDRFYNDIIKVLKISDKYYENLRTDSKNI